MNMNPFQKDWNPSAEERVFNDYTILTMMLSVLQWINSFSKFNMLFYLKFFIYFLFFRHTRLYITFLFIILQKIIATIVLTNVATIAGPTIAAGFTLPYWLR